jgi:hypothetical protein
MANEVVNDKSGSRFVLEIEGDEVYLLYDENKSMLDLYSTYTPPNLRGKGLAAKVVKAALEYAKEKKLKVIPSCWYARKFIEENPEYQNLVNH